MRSSSVLRGAALAALAGVFLLAMRTNAAEQAPFARITAVFLRGTNLVVEAEAGGGFAKVTLESSPRVGRHSWEPRAVRHLGEAAAGAAEFSFTLPISAGMELLRVRGDLEAVLPASFYEGETNFVNSSGAGGGPIAGGVADFGNAPREETAGDEDAGREVVESDIWKLHEDTLYFFNQYRGLQIIDVSDPDAPELAATFDVPAAGEQMYLMDSSKIILLARDTCSWYGDSSESRVLLLENSEGGPQLAAQLPVPGYIVESRLVGTALYVVANGYQRRAEPGQDDAGEVWEWGSLICSFDLSNFNQPVAMSRDWVTGYNNVIMATGRFLFAAQYEYQGPADGASRLHIYDIASPDGAFEKLAVYNTLGRVQDKFKMNVDGDVLTVVSQRETWPSRPTYVETVSLEDPRNPERLGSLKIIENEQLHATRFEGKTLYAVTFMRVDPLWIIDLSDPASPRIVGELEIPGWSTYIEPLDGYLLTIGVDTTNGWRTAVQLFDVRDPARPALASKVVIGDSYSGSEANQDEKAFQVLPDENLVLVPFHGNSGEQWINGVQIIDLFPGELVKRGVIEQEFQPRRATLHRERILSISARELLSVDASDRDHPEVVARTELSWAADRLHLAGDFLLEIDAYSGRAPAIRIVGADAYSELLNEVALTNLPYLGSTVKAGKLYVLQGQSRELIYPEVWSPEDYGPVATNAGTVAVTVYDLSQLPDLPLFSQDSEEHKDFAFHGRHKAVWVADSTVIWAGNQSGYRWWWWGGPVLAEARMGAGMAADALIAPWGWGGSTGQFIAVETSGEGAGIASILHLGESSGWWNFSEAFAAGGLLYTSHTASEYDPLFDPPPYETQRWDGSGYVTAIVDPKPGAWLTRTFLNVIDYADPEEPVARAPVNIPGPLIGVGREGALLYTRGTGGAVDSFQSQTENISASAYDGVQASLIDSIPLTNNWPRPSLVSDGFVYLGRASADGEEPSRIEIWTLNAGGKFESVNSIELAVPVSQFAKYGPMLAAQTGRIKLFDASSPPALAPLGSGSAQTCYGVLLDEGAADISRGLWLPLGWYGVVKIPVINTE